MCSRGAAHRPLREVVSSPLTEAACFTPRGDAYSLLEELQATPLKDLHTAPLEVFHAAL